MKIIMINGYYPIFFITIKKLILITLKIDTDIDNLWGPGKNEFKNITYSSNQKRCKFGGAASNVHPFAPN
jgi:hypothetical protein